MSSIFWMPITLWIMTLLLHIQNVSHIWYAECQPYLVCIISAIFGMQNVSHIWHAECQPYLASRMSAIFGMQNVSHIWHAECQPYLVSRMSAILGMQEVIHFWYGMPFGMPEYHSCLVCHYNCEYWLSSSTTEFSFLDLKHLLSRLRLLYVGASVSSTFLLSSLTTRNKMIHNYHQWSLENSSFTMIHINQ